MNENNSKLTDDRILRATKQNTMAKPIDFASSQRENVLVKTGRKQMAWVERAKAKNK